LDRLLLAGETPVGLLAQISSSLRRLAAATRLVLQAESAGRRIDLRSALRDIGVNAYYVEKSERQLRRLGRQRGARLYQWLLDADLDLKGSSTLAPRLVLERLIVKVAGAE
jgi:DNA polymerase-3 subunit delta